jgi:TolA-binding protein
MRRKICGGLLVLLALAYPRAGLASERRAYEAAAQAFHQGFFERAEAAFAEFQQKYSSSPRTAEAALYQAEARLQLTNFPGAIDLLSGRLPQAGKLADEYLFWLAEARFRAGEYARAGDDFEQVLLKFPASARSLDATIGASAAHAKLEQWSRTTGILQNPTSAFQAALRTNLVNDLIVRGYLLLGKALYKQRDFAAAESVLQPSGVFPLIPTLAWERQELLCHIQLDSGRPEEAIKNIPNLLTQASYTENPALKAESAVFEATVWERLGQVEKAIAAYSRNLAEGMPPQRQQEALLKMAALARTQDQLSVATQRLEELLSRYPNAEAADLAWLTLGELRLRRFEADLHAEHARTAGTPALTNLLDQASEAFNTLTNRFPQSSLNGKAQLDLGACLLLKGQLQESLAAFQSAVNRLPFSADQAYAYSKLGETQFNLANFDGAIASYSAIISGFDSLPEAKTNLFEGALYQLVRAGLAAGKEAVYTNALQKILDWYPNGFYAEPAILQAGQGISRQGSPARARAIYQDITLKAANTPLLPKVQLAVARTYEQETNWDQAAREYTLWLDRFTNSPARPQADYSRAIAYFRGGHDTNALACFTNFIAQYPTNELAPLAQWWLGDYYFSKGELTGAELSYQAIHLTWPGTDLAFSALMMAGRTAAARQDWSGAIGYFTNLVAQPACPSALKAQAMFGYADALMTMGDLTPTNRNANYDQAIAAFDYLCQQYSSNQIAMLALGGKACCLLQRARTASELQKTLLVFQEVATNSQADVVTRSKAKTGLGQVLEKWAELETGPSRAKRLNEALNHYLDVFNDNEFLRPAEKADLFWTKRAGLEAARVAESLGLWTQAASVYSELRTLLPALAPYFDNKVRQAEKNVRRTAAR